MVRDGGQGALTRLRHWVFDRPPVEWITSGFLVLLLISGLFGGLREVPPDPPPPLTVGKAVHAEPLTLTIERVYWSSGLPRIPKAVDAPRGVREVYAVKPSGARLLVVEGTVSNTSDSTVYGSIAGDALRLEGAGEFVSRTGAIVSGDKAAPTVMHLPDRQPLSRLQPAVSYPVAWVWDQAKGAVAPTQLTIAARQHTWRQSSLDFSWGWFDPATLAVGTFPVTERRGS